MNADRLAFIVTISAIFWSQPVPVLASQADVDCRTAIYKSSAKLGSTSMKQINACQAKVQLKGMITTDCNSPGVADSVTGNKMRDAYDALGDAIPAACASVPPTMGDCPSPGNFIDSGGSSSGIDDTTELAACEQVIHFYPIYNLRNHILRPDAGPILSTRNSKAIIKCAKAIGKAGTKLWSAVSKDRGKCQLDLEEIAGDDLPYDCSTHDSGKIAAAESRLEATIGKACSPLSQAELALLRSCDDDTAGIAECVANAVKKHASGATAMAFEFSGVCPESLRMVVRGTGSDGGPSSESRIDEGSSGRGHGGYVAGGFDMAMNLTCTGSDCASCSLTQACDAGNCRCSNDSATRCTIPFAQDICGAGNACLVHFGPPQPNMAGGVPICMVNTIRSLPVGVYGVGTGGLDLPITKHASTMYLGIALDRPCPVCSGASVGLAGTCSGGARNGSPCTTSATDAAYGNTSYDCPPAVAALLSGAGSTSRTFTTASTSLVAEDACDGAYSGYDCACGVCSLNTTQSCRTDAECTATSSGNCSNGPAPDRKPNDCATLTCFPDTTGAGTCDVGPDDFYCDALLGSDGQAILPCLSNADCAVHGAGACTTTRRRGCFAGGVSAQGVFGFDGAELVATYCNLPTTNPALNALLGLPGPGRTRLDVGLTLLCSDDTTEYELGGSNCP